MEGKERHVDEVEELERDFGLELGAFEALVEPGTVEGTAAERVAAFLGEGVPIGDGGADMVFHPLAGDDFVLVVVAVGQRVLAVRAFILDLAQAVEKVTHVRVSSIAGYRAR